jgi:hypothetical protein
MKNFLQFVKQCCILKSLAGRQQDYISIKAGKPATQTNNSSHIANSRVACNNRSSCNTRDTRTAGKGENTIGSVSKVAVQAYNSRDAIIIKVIICSKDAF